MGERSALSTAIPVFLFRLFPADLSNFWILPGICFEDDRGDLRSALGLLRPGAQGEPAGRRAHGAEDGDGPARGSGAAARDGELSPDHARVGLR